MSAKAARRTGANPLLAYVELLHLPPVAMVLLGTAGCMVIAAGGWPPLDRLALVLSAVLLTQLAISVHNDYCDRLLDAQTKPWRALPRGLLTPRAALAWTATLTALGLLAAAPLGPEVVALVAFGPAAGFVYNAALKRTAWSWLPFWVALPTIPLVAFAAEGRAAPQLGLIYLIAGPLVISVHLADTLSDIDSDQAWGVRGFAHRLGARGARWVCWAAMASAQALAWLLWPSGTGPNAGLALSCLALLSAVAFDRWRIRGGHWLAIMASAVTLAVGWLSGAGSR
ncbi:MAG: UbiA family prenyltransferase [Chloroflexi bacterium]|nr:UbiA family prenyltransferase [Chloroflexota bacterium]